MKRREHCREAEAPLEADRQIDERDDERKEDREERLALELAPDLGAHRLGPADRITARAESVRERGVDRGRGGLRGALRGGARRAEPRPHDVLVGRAELLDLGIVDPRGIERPADAVRPHRVRRPDLDQRAARELDRVVQAVYQKQRESGDDDGGREAVGPAAPLDEVVVGVGEEADHVRRSEWPCPAGAAARSCRRFAPRRSRSPSTRRYR